MPGVGWIRLAASLGCRGCAGGIVSAQRHVRAYEEARARDGRDREVLVVVVDWLIRETAAGLN